jgi:translation initiation factor IF-1
MTLRKITFAAATAALLLGGCALPTPTATREEVLTATATIQSVDAATRHVTLRDDATGETYTVRAGDEVRNFDQLAAGDVVVVDYYESVTLAMAAPGTPTTAPESTLLTGRAPEGTAPGGLAVLTTTVLVTVSNYDEESEIATFMLPDGTLRRARVAPEMRGFAESVNPGDKVEVTLTEAAAISIVETGA